MISELIVFTYSDCKYCNSLKNRLKEANIDFFDFDVIKNRPEWLEIVNQAGIDIVPTVYIKEKNSEKGTFYQPGRDYNDEDEIFEIIKNYSVKE